MEVRDVMFLLLVCAMSFCVATILKFKEHGVNPVLGLLLSLLSPVVMLFEVRLMLLAALEKGLFKNRSAMACVLRGLRLLYYVLCSIPILHTLSVQFVCHIIKEHDEFTLHMDPVIRLYDEFEKTAA